MAGESLQDIGRRFTKRGTPRPLFYLHNYNQLSSHGDVYLPGSSESKTEGKNRKKTSRRFKFPKPTTIDILRERERERGRESYTAKKQADILLRRNESMSKPRTR